MAAGQKPAIIIALAPMALGRQTRARMRVVAIGDRGALDEAPATLTLEKSGERVAGSTGCNNYFATVQILGSGMRFEKAGSTRRGCPGAIAVQEKPFLDALNIAATHRSMGEFLELLDEVKPARSSIDKPY
jgi:heat shock protein HslJ